MFTGFSFYDDEGSLLLMSQWLLEGHPVYRDFHSIYGPFYFLYKWIAHTLLGGVVSHSTARLIGVALWTGSALLSFVCTFLVTRSRIAALAAWLLALRSLAFIAAEPGHPHEICILLVLAILALSCTGPASRPRRLQLAIMGALAAALTLTKINIGVYVCAALVLSALAATRHSGARRILFPIVAAACVAAPAGVMLQSLGIGWARAACVLITASILLVIAMLGAHGLDRYLDLRHWLAMALGFALCAGAVFAWVIAQGGSPETMVRSVLLENLQEAHTWTVPIFVGPWGAAAGLASFVVMLFWMGGRFRRVIPWIKLAIGVMVPVLMVIQRDGTAGAHPRPQIAFAIGMPFLWLLLVPPERDTIPLFYRGLLAATTVLHGLSVYPVAGSQLRLTMVLLGIAMVVYVHDSLPLVANEWNWDASKRRLARVALAALPLAGYLFSITSGVRTYAHFPPLGLAGTTGIRIDPDDRRTYHWVVDKVRASCESLVSFPAMHSLYLWSGKIPPVYQDLDGWQPYLNSQRQSVEHRLLERPRACVVFVDDLVKFWLPPEDTEHRTLLGFIRQRFVEQDFLPHGDQSYARKGFHLLVPKP
jgi:hypothetical protein